MFCPLSLLFCWLSSIFLINKEIYKTIPIQFLICFSLFYEKNFTLWSFLVESWRRRHLWVEFVVGSLLCSDRFFSRYSGFPLPIKTNTSKFQFDLERRVAICISQPTVLKELPSAPWINKSRYSK